MSMFDYDARPVTPLPVLVGTTASRGAYAIRDFLSRNGYPFEWADACQPDAVRAVLGVAEVEPSVLPLCILPDGSRLASATVEQVAAGLGMVAAPSLPEYDLTIVGAGPAGLAAAVNPASEGLRTVVVEAVEPGGQAGTTSMIENYLGFPNGISGSELATRAMVQARRFGAELLLAGPLVGVSADGPGYAAELSDGHADTRAGGAVRQRSRVAPPGRARDRRCGRRQLSGPGGRPVLPVRPAGHASGPRPRPRRVDVAVPHRSPVGDPEC